MAGRLIHIMLGGPAHKIQVNGVVHTFEDHSYCGPSKLNKRGDPLDNQPDDFLEAASLWAQQGRRVENGLCRWDRPGEEILEHVGGNNYRVTGYTDPKKGE